MPTDQAQIPPSILTLPDGATLAYHLTPGRGPGVVFLHGFHSDMGGDKALAVEAWCQATGRACLRFDQRGHGQSSGRFEEGTIGLWASDTARVLDILTEGPQVLVGSSMGGWLMLLTALARPGRVAGLLGINAAPDFTEDLIWPALTAESRQRIECEGVSLEREDPDTPPLPLTRLLFEDGRRNLVLRSPIDFKGSVHLLQGMRDASVPWQTALRVQERLTSEDVRVTLVKDGTHRLSRPADLALLTHTLAGLIEDLATY
ncbi:alpha/beta fold hydrolase [Pararhodospirillum photometricum]|nr:alpha/beta hydrolase [Pararhodospirillum photometricum]